MTCRHFLTCRPFLICRHFSRNETNLNCVVISKSAECPYLVANFRGWAYLYCGGCIFLRSQVYSIVLRYFASTLRDFEAGGSSTGASICDVGDELAAAVDSPTLRLCGTESNVNHSCVMSCSDTRTIRIPDWSKVTAGDTPGSILNPFNPSGSIPLGSKMHPTAELVTTSSHFSCCLRR